MTTSVRVALVALGLVVAGTSADGQRRGGGEAPALTTPQFAALVANLSEAGGDFGGDNLISNEQSYLRVLPALTRAGLAGGAYVGVGPEQNFTYIARTRPAIAYIVDIRRDNLLLHLLFKAIFANAPTRLEYLCLLTGRAPPPQPAAWRDKPIDELVAHVDATRPVDVRARAALDARVGTALAGAGVPLSRADLDTIHRFHAAFVDAGLSIAFQVRGQGPRSYYPTLRALLAERGPDSRPGGFLATDASYQFLRSMQARNLIVPVVGDVSGPKAMRAIATDIASRRLMLSAFYISNVEYYLFADGRFDAYAANLRQFPHTAASTVIRSVFPSGYRLPLPQSMPGHYSTSLTQPLDAFLAGRYRNYFELVEASAASR
jgi:hypothetical protein